MEVKRGSKPNSEVRQMVPRVNSKVREKATVETVIRLLGAGAFLAASFVFPALPLAVKPIIDAKQDWERNRREKEWARFNPWLLRQTLRRLKKQRLVQVVDSERGLRVVLTEKGMTRQLQYKLEEMVIKRPPHWDGKWRLIIYDISKYKKRQQEAFRGLLKKLKFLQLQKSVYMTPFPCQNEIEFLRQAYNLADDVLYCVVERIERDEAYRKYFGV